MNIQTGYQVLPSSTQARAKGQSLPQQTTNATPFGTEQQAKQLPVRKTEPLIEPFESRTDLQRRQAERVDLRTLRIEPPTYSGRNAISSYEATSGLDNGLYYQQGSTIDILV